MANTGYSVVVTAVDRVSGTLNKINAKIAGSQKAASARTAAAVAPWQRLGRSIAATSKQLGVSGAISGVGKVAGAFRNVARSGLEAFRNVSRIVPPLGIITSALTLAGLYKLVTNFAQLGTQTGLAARRIGIGTTQLQGLQGAARLAGTSAEGLTSGLQGLGQTLYDAAGGRNTEAVGLFTQLGIAWRDSAGHAKSVADVLPQLADKIAGLKDPYAQAQAATIAFGGAAEDMLPFLRLGSKGIEEYTAAALKYGHLSPQQIKDANDLRMAQVRVDLAINGLVNTIAAKLSPTLSPLLTQLADWIALNRDWIAQKVDEVIKRVATAIKNIDWKQVKQDIDDVWTKIKAAVDLVGGWKDALVGLAAVMGTSWVLGMLAPIARVASAILGITTSILAVPGVLAAVAVAAAAAGIVDAVNHGSTAKDDNYDVLQADMGKQTPEGVKKTGDTLRQVMQAHKMPNASIAGLFGNVLAESSADPSRQQPGGPGYGLAQWGADRQADFKRLMGKDIHGSTAAEQAEFIWKELQEPQYKTVYDGLMSGKLTPSQATELVEIDYEKPKVFDGPNGIGRRSSYANAYYNGLFVPTNVQPPAPPGPTDNAKKLGFGGGPGRLPSSMVDHTGMYQSALDSQWYPMGGGPSATGKDPTVAPPVTVPPPAPDVTLSPRVNDVLGSLRAGTLDVNLKVSSDGAVKTTSSVKGNNVGKLRVETPMQAHAA